MRTSKHGGDVRNARPKRSAGTKQREKNETTELTTEKEKEKKRMSKSWLIFFSSVG